MGCGGGCGAWERVAWRVVAWAVVMGACQIMAALPPPPKVAAPCQSSTTKVLPDAPRGVNGGMAPRFGRDAWNGKRGKMEKVLAHSSGVFAVAIFHARRDFPRKCAELSN